MDWAFKDAMASNPDFPTENVHSKLQAKQPTRDSSNARHVRRPATARGLSHSLFFLLVFAFLRLSSLFFIFRISSIFLLLLLGQREQLQFTAKMGNFTPTPSAPTPARTSQKFQSLGRAGGGGGKLTESTTSRGWPLETIFRQLFLRGSAEGLSEEST